MEITIVKESSSEPLSRAVHMTNDEWLILSQCVEAFAGTYRAQHSQTIATYLTRGQVDNALAEADKMDQLLKRLDHIQVKLVS
jgi:hypothetical protein